MTLNGTEYFYIRNGQGDITGLIDTAGTQVVSYVYDSWGKLISVDGSLKDTVGLKNPYRYRGYRYDTETGLYYLQSRYYNPEMGRYINADDVEFIGASGTPLGYNLFAYCENNPVNNSDPSGYLGLPWQIKFGLITGIASALYQMYKYTRSVYGTGVSTKEYIKGLAKSFATGFVRGFIVGLLSTVPTAWKWGLAGGAISLVFKVMTGEAKTDRQCLDAFLNGWTMGVSARSLSLLMDKIYTAGFFANLSLENKQYLSYCVDFIGGLGVGRILKW